MAWNDPGNKDQDPWGRRNDQGPPDLDEVIRKLQKKIEGFFGGGKGGGSGGGSGLIWSILIAVVLIWGFAGFYTLDETERAVVLRLGKAQDQLVTPGLRWNPPLIDEVLVESVTRFRTHKDTGLVLTEDENIVSVSIEVQYSIDDAEKFMLRVRDPERSVEHATESALRHVIGGSKMLPVITAGRAEIALEVQGRLQDHLNTYQTGIIVSKVNIDKAEVPTEVKEAYDDVNKAQEDRVRLQNEAETYANGIVPEARGVSERLKAESEAYKYKVIAKASGEAARFLSLYEEYKKAPDVTRERLYLDSIEEVLSKTSKVMVDVEGGNNLMYLPLDKLVSQHSAELPQSVSLSQEDVRNLTKLVARELKQQQALQGGRR